MWPPEALEFLRELEDNNDRDWFRANRERYDAHLLEPARALADRLRHLGTPHFFRPYNDTRFHARPPLKEQLGVAIGYGATGGFYFEISLDGLLVAAGIHRPATPQLERFRRAVDDARRAKSLDRALRPATQAGLELAPPALKRAPRGYPVDHPRVDLLRRRELTVARRHGLEPWLHTADCDERIRAQLDAARPFVRWLRETVAA